MKKGRKKNSKNEDRKEAIINEFRNNKKCIHTEDKLDAFGDKIKDIFFDSAISQDAADEAWKSAKPKKCKKKIRKDVEQLLEKGVTKDLIVAAINKQKTRKAVGLDLIATEIFKSDPD